MAEIEAERFDLYLGLKKTLGDDMADKLINHLPPSKWSDFARQSDMLARFDDMDGRFRLVDQKFDLIERRFEQVERRFEQVERRFEQIDRRFEQIDQRLDLLDQRIDRVDLAIDRLENRIRVLTGFMITVGLALTVMFVQLNMSIAALR